MAIVPETPRTNRITLASPSAGPFLVGFKIFSTGSLEVYVDGAVSTDWTLSATFVDGEDDDATITFGSTLPTSTVIQIDGAEVPARPADYLNPDPGLTRKMNLELARITAVLSEVTMKVNRAVRSLDEIDAAPGVETVDLTNLAAYADEAEQARDEVVAIQAMIPRRRGPWATATSYVFADLVQEDGSTYFCLIPHTSGTFNADLAALRWEVWAAKGVAGAGIGDVVAANAGSEYSGVAATFRANVGLAIGSAVQAFNQLLGAIAGIGTTGFVARLSGSTAAARTMTGTANQIAVADGNGVAGNPTFSLVLPSQAEAQAGADANKPMPALRVKEAIEALGEKGRVLLATKTASASANLAFTEFNNALYRWYEFELENVKPATDAVDLALQTSSNGGSSYDAGASDYGHSGYGVSDGLLTALGDNTSTAILLGVAGNVGNAANEKGMTGTLKVYHAGQATHTRVIGELTFDTTASIHSRVSVAGRRTADQDTDAIRFLFTSGNIASGTIRMYGVRA